MFFVGSHTHTHTHVCAIVRECKLLVGYVVATKSFVFMSNVYACMRRDGFSIIAFSVFFIGFVRISARLSTFLRTLSRTHLTWPPAWRSRSEIKMRAGCGGIWSVAPARARPRLRRLRIKVCLQPGDRRPRRRARAHRAPAETHTHLGSAMSGSRITRLSEVSEMIIFINESN